MRCGGVERDSFRHKPIEPEVLERHGSGRRPSWLTGTNPLPASILSVFHPCSIRGRISACAAIVPDLSLITTNRRTVRRGCSSLSRANPRWRLARSVTISACKPADAGDIFWVHTQALRCRPLRGLEQRPRWISPPWGSHPRLYDLAPLRGLEQRPLWISPWVRTPGSMISPASCGLPDAATLAQRNTGEPPAGERPIFHQPRARLRAGLLPPGEAMELCGERFTGDSTQSVVRRRARGNAPL